MDLSKLKHLYIKGHYQQSEKITHWMGENICKSCICKGLTCRAHKELLQFNKNKTTWLKNGQMTREDISLKKTGKLHKHIKIRSTS